MIHPCHIFSGKYLPLFSICPNPFPIPNSFISRWVNHSEIISWSICLFDAVFKLCPVINSNWSLDQFYDFRLFVMVGCNKDENDIHPYLQYLPKNGCCGGELTLHTRKAYFNIPSFAFNMYIISTYSQMNSRMNNPCWADWFTFHNIVCMKMARKNV